MKFITKTQKKRSAVSPVIATLLLIAIAVAAAIIVYAFVTGLIGGLSNGSGSNLYPTTATLVSPTGSTVGTIVITVLNSGNTPITGIQVSLGTLTDSFGNTCMGEFVGAVAPTDTYCSSAVIAPAALAVGACPAAAAAKPAVFCTSTNTVVFVSNSLPVGGQVSSTVGINSANLQSGNTYSFTVTFDLSNGGSHTELVTATAEL